MTMTLHARAALARPVAPGSGLGSWVEAHQEPCRGGRTYRLLVNHRTHQAMELTDAEARICTQLNKAGPGGDIPRQRPRSSGSCASRGSWPAARRRPLRSAGSR